MKIRQLESMLLKAGFQRVEGKGSHRKYFHGPRRLVISGKPGHDAKPYQIKMVKQALEDIGHEKEEN